MSIHFTVDGLPAAKGSKNQFGGESNPNVKPWQAAIASAAREAMDGAEPLAGSVDIAAAFYFPRPKSHYGTGRYAQTLKVSAPKYVNKKPDIDKLLRALLDGMTGFVFRDDAQVAALLATKMYGSPGAKVYVSEHTPDLDELEFLQRAGLIPAPLLVEEER